MSFGLGRSFLAATLLASLALLCPFLPTGAAAQDADSAAVRRSIAESVTAVLQGDSGRAVAALEAVPADRFGGDDRAYRACMLERFGQGSAPRLVDATGDARVDELLWLYQEYWWRALTAPASLEQLGDALRERLRVHLGAHTADWTELEEMAAQRLLASGYHAQLGRTPPLRELMIWRTQNSERYDVVLPEGSHRVRVELLDDFVSRGWSSYGRCGRGSSGGWATKDRLYAVMPWFEGDLESDAFRASLLGHETQHFADLGRFPDLEPWELEYRAKLTELWKASDTLPALLARFAGSQGDDPNAPHPYANKRVLSALRERLQGQNVATVRADLGDVPPQVLRAAAREQLIEDSLQRAGVGQRPSGFQAKD